MMLLFIRFQMSSSGQIGPYTNPAIGYLKKSIGPTFFFLFILFAGGADGLHAQDQQKTFRAGASLSNITPPLGEPIVGNWNSPPATYVHDQLYAKSLVLDDGDTRLVFVLVDNVGVNREVFDAAKSLVRNETGLEKKNMLMAATHTHSSISAGGEGQKRRGWHYGEPLDEYQRFLARRIADGVRIAMENLQPAEIAWGSVDAPEHVFNRRWIMEEPVSNPLGTQDKAQMNPGHQNPALVEPAGPTDPEVSFIAVQSKEGTPISVLGNYSLHYIGGVPGGHLSADYFAVFGDRLKELLQGDRQHPPFVGIMSNGTSGDINNLNFAEAPERKPPYEQMQMVGRDVAQKVHRVYQGLEFREWVPLRSAQSELTLDVRRASPEIQANMEKIRDRPEGAEPLYHRLEKVYAGRIAQLEEWPDQIDIQLQTFGIGELGISAIPFEVFAEIGLEIKEESPFTDTFTIELANGSYGYLPTPPQHELGGYETWLSTNRVEKEASSKIVAELMKLFNEVQTNQ
ncbi:hypothetical protein [Fodinibius sp.]|uniref:hypothetical protein n=1 Tax=Fodinibius sp. TaxID=1872440 RepID=UPI0035621414